MKNSIKLNQKLLLLNFFTPCKSKTNKEELIKDYEDQKNYPSKVGKFKMEAKYSHKELGISGFHNVGLIIFEGYLEEKIGTWKSIPETKEYGNENDKGCKITTSDKLGKEKIHLLEKQLKTMPNNKDHLIELLFKKLKRINSRKINLDKKEFTKFINSLINNN